MTRKQATFYLGSLTVLFLILTVNPLLFQSYWENEADYVLHARLPIALIPSSLVPDQEPLYYFLLHFWIRLFGESEAATRSLSLLFSLGAFYFLYRLSGCLFRKREVGILACFFFSISSFLVEFSQEAKHWMMFVFLTLSSLFFLYRWLNKGRARDLFLFLGLGVVNLFTCQYAFFVLPIQCLFLALDRSRRGRLVYGILIGAFMVGLVEAVRVWGGFQYVDSRGAGWGLPAVFPDFFIHLHRQLFYYTEEIRYPPPVFVGLAVAYFYFLLGLFRMGLKQTLLFAGLFLLPLCVSFSIADSSSIRNRYFIHLIPLFWLSTSFGIFSIRRIPIRLASMGLIAAASFCSLYNYFTLHHKEDWKSAVSYVTPKLRPNDIVVITPYWVKAGFQFYSPFRFLASSEANLKELSHFDRAWVFLVYGGGNIDRGSFPLFEKKDFQKISVNGFDLSAGSKPPPDSYPHQLDLREFLESAEVSVHPFGRSKPLRFPHFVREAFHLGGEEKGEGGEGLLYDYWSREPLSAGSKRWHVVARSIQRSGGALRKVIWAHPPIDGALVIRYPKIVLQENLSGFYGFTDLSVVNGRAPVRFEVFVGGKRVYEDLKGNSQGWKEFTLDTASWKGQETDVEFWVIASDNRWRHFCFNAAIQ